MVFKPHLVLSTVILAGLAVAVARVHTSVVFLAWGSATACLLSSFFVSHLCRRGLGRLHGGRAGNQPATISVLPVPATVWSSPTPESFPYGAGGRRDVGAPAYIGGEALPA